VLLTLRKVTDSAPIPGTTELANSFTYSTWGAPSVDGTHDNSANGGADYGDLGFRYLYVGQFDVQWDNTFGLGLHYMHARHYAQRWGVSCSPILTTSRTRCTPTPPTTQSPSLIQMAPSCGWSSSSSSCG